MFKVHTIHIKRGYTVIRTVVPDALGGGVMSIYITDNRYSHRRPDYQFPTTSRVPIDLTSHYFGERGYYAFHT